MYNWRGASSDISPDMSMRVRGGHRDRSRPVRLLYADMAAEYKGASQPGQDSPVLGSGDLQSLLKVAERMEGKRRINE